MRLKVRKFILYPLMDLIFNYKTRDSRILPMYTFLAEHPATSSNAILHDCRTITYEDWIKHIKLWKK